MPKNNHHEQSIVKVKRKMHTSGKLNLWEARGKRRRGRRKGKRKEIGRGRGQEKGKKEDEGTEENEG